MALVLLSGITNHLRPWNVGSAEKLRLRSIICIGNLDECLSLSFEPHTVGAYVFRRDWLVFPEGVPGES